MCVCACVFMCRCLCVCVGGVVYTRPGSCDVSIDRLDDEQPCCRHRCVCVCVCVCECVCVCVLRDCIYARTHVCGAVCGSLQCVSVCGIV